MGISIADKKAKKESNSGSKRRSMIILEVSLRKKVSYVFQIFLNVFHSCLVPDYRISMFVLFLANLRLSIFKIFLGGHAPDASRKAKMDSRPRNGENFFGLIRLPHYLHHSAAPDMVSSGRCDDVKSSRIKHCSESEN